MIVIIWLTSTAMAVSPHLVGLGSAAQIDTCQLTDNLTYQLISTFLAFYLPLTSLCVIYWKIFQSAKFRIRKKAFNNNNNNNNINNNPKAADLCTKKIPTSVASNINCEFHFK